MQISLHLQVFIQLKPQHLAILELELELLAIERRIVLVDNPVVVRTDNNDVRRVVVLRMGEIVDVVGCEQRAHRHGNGHPVIQQRPVHRLLQYESIVVIHQSYISFFSCLLLLVFLGIFPQRLWCYYFPASTFIWPNATDNTLFFQFGHDTLYLSFRKRTHRCQFFCGYG